MGDIYAAEYLSQLKGVGKKIALLAINDTSTYDVDALSEALKQRREQLTYTNPEPPDDI